MRNWPRAWRVEVDLAVKVLLSVSMVWVYLTTIFGVRVTEGGRQWIIYLGGLVALNALALVVLEALPTAVTDRIA